MTDIVVTAVCLAFAAVPVGAQGSAQSPTRGASSKARTVPSADSVFAAVQKRGADARAMGIDQSTATHRFDALRDGGRIELQHVARDSAGIAQIRQHMREIAVAFAAGDFRTPAFVHMQQVPGTTVMAAKRATITYAVRDLPRGADVRITTRNADALAAVHQFIAFQRKDHRAGGKGTPQGAAHAHGAHKPGGHRQ